MKPNVPDSTPTGRGLQVVVAQRINLQAEASCLNGMIGYDFTSTIAWKSSADDAL